MGFKQEGKLGATPEGRQAMQVCGELKGHDAICTDCIQDFIFRNQFTDFHLNMA